MSILSTKGFLLVVVLVECAAGYSFFQRGYGPYSARATCFPSGSGCMAGSKGCCGRCRHQQCCGTFGQVCNGDNGLCCSGICGSYGVCECQLKGGSCEADVDCCDPPIGPSVSCIGRVCGGRYHMGYMI